MPGPNGVCDCCGDCLLVELVTTLSPSLSPSSTSVATPSVMPVLIGTGCGLPSEPRTYTLRCGLCSRFLPAQPPPGGREPPPPDDARAGTVLVASGGRYRNAALGIFNASSR